MANKKPSVKFTSETARKAGQKSKRKPLDLQWRDKLNNALGSSNRTALDAIYALLLKEANNGNIMAIRELLDRSFGKSKQVNEVSGLDGGEIDTKLTIKFEE